MITSPLMVCADRVIRDAQTNNISVINIIEGITPEGLPLFIQRFMIFAFLERNIKEDPSQIKCKVRIKISGNKLLENVIVVDFKDKERNRLIYEIGGLVIPTNGTFEASLLLGRRVLNKYELIVQPPRRIDVAKQEA